MNVYRVYYDDFSGMVEKEGFNCLWIVAENFGSAIYTAELTLNQHQHMTDIAIMGITHIDYRTKEIENENAAG